MQRAGKLGAALVAVILLLSPAGASAGGGGGGGGPCAGFRSGSTVVMRDNCFDGVAHFAANGTTLVVENQGVLPHSFTAVDGSFDSGVLQPGQRAEIEPGNDGVFRVVCTLHGSRDGGGMAGVLLIGNPKIDDVGDGAGLAAAIGEHDARLLMAVDDQGASLSSLERDMQDLERSSASLKILVGAAAVLAAVAAIGVWTRPVEPQGRLRTLRP